MSAKVLWTYTYLKRELVCIAATSTRLETPALQYTKSETKMHNFCSTVHYCLSNAIYLPHVNPTYFIRYTNRDHNCWVSSPPIQKFSADISSTRKISVNNGGTQLITTCPMDRTLALPASYARVETLGIKQSDTSFTLWWINTTSANSTLLSPHSNVRTGQCRINKGPHTHASYKSAVRYLSRNKERVEENINKNIKDDSQLALNFYSSRINGFDELWLNLFLI
jgi:hypothetical protein